jgi:hypothetical protein
MSRDVRVSLGGLAIAVAAAAVWFSGRSATEALAQAPAARTQWDYQSASTELASLSNKLTELGNDGWEVVSVISTDATVDSQVDTKPHLLCQRVEVVAKRPRAK